jgi:XTP/dITP diphosphohydrolase
MNKIVFVTGNQGKFEEAQSLFLDTGIKLIQEKIETLEIQSNETEKIARYSAELAGKKLKKALFVLDRSFHIEALNGFPGPYVKFVNSCLTADQILAMLRGCSNKRAYWISAIGCYLPGKRIKTFVGRTNGMISDRIDKTQGYMVDKIFIPEGKTIPLSGLNKKEREEIWNNCSCWKELIAYLKKN